ncbi:MULTISPECIES: hypothetical protein [unclassified Wenzhouxiangella]|uniref:hypothetical protein n=1 Tax=unclassified Wenzhouxiangella TaxID=2613841 RepID=UPI000E3252A4|nr:MULTISPECIES: hypothetical protein [unclassified Wenzhouxiangella]RFF27251.1 hypothetical protein DZK25_08695 [Wenzhouxiangella sp. 15181]RFP69291.1 hypothetical protein DZK26_04725 [Wenzhouxiangella sp. 15190]
MMALGLSAWRDDREWDQQVAIKVLTHGIDSDDAQRRPSRVQESADETLPYRFRDLRGDLDGILLRTLALTGLAAVVTRRPEAR